MKQVILILFSVFFVFCLCACRQGVETSLMTPSIEEEESKIEQTTAAWRARFEVRDTDEEVRKLQKHFTENREILEKIALGMYKEQRESVLTLCARKGKIYAQDSNSVGFDYSKPIDSETGDLIADYYAQGYSKNQDIFICEEPLFLNNYNVCVFSYDSFLENDGVLTDVMLLYCEEESPEEFYYNEYVTLNDHWIICVEDFPFE